MQNKAIEQKPIKHDIRPKQTTITISDNELPDPKEFYIKSSEVWVNRSFVRTIKSLSPLKKW